MLFIHVHITPLIGCLTPVLEELDLQQAIAGEEAKLYFVVPAHRFDRCKKQKEFVMGKNQPFDRSRIGALQAKIGQYALKLNTRRVMQGPSSCWMRLLPSY